MSKPKITFKVNYQKTLEAILYVLKKNQTLHVYNLMKVLFEADKVHLNLYGRPVTGDTYYKLDFGTVPSAAYNMVKFDQSVLEHLTDDSYPISRTRNILVAERDANKNLFSETDMEALDAGLEKYGNLPFGAVKELNHQEKCWIESQFKMPIDFALMIDNKEILEDLLDLELSPFNMVI
jgi:uncharacterized phage-associated protein